MNIKHFYDERTGTFSYVVFDEATRDAVVIDPVLDYEPVGSKIWTESVDEVIDFVNQHQLKLHYVMETHAHADHLSGAPIIKEKFPDVRTVIGKNITVVQKYFKNLFNLDDSFPTDGRQFDVLMEDGEVIEAGSLKIEAIFTPGHTPACATYKIEDAIFTGDSIFMPDAGTGRCDFPAGDARDMFRSITQRLYTLPDDTRVFICHDYQPGGRELKCETTIAEQKAHNIDININTTEDEYVNWRRARDSELAAPKLLFQSIQVNIDAGELPSKEKSGQRYFKIPVNVFRPQADGELSLDEAS